MRALCPNQPIVETEMTFTDLLALAYYLLNTLYGWLPDIAIFLWLVVAILLGFAALLVAIRLCVHASEWG